MISRAITIVIVTSSLGYCKHKIWVLFGQVRGDERGMDKGVIGRIDKQQGNSYRERGRGRGRGENEISWKECN